MYTKLIELLEEGDLEKIKTFINDNFEHKSTLSTQNEENNNHSIIEISTNKKHELSEPINDENNKLNETVLHLAARYNNILLINWLLLDKGAIADIKDAEGFTPWLRAVKENRLATAGKSYLFSKSRCFTENNFGENAAHFLVKFSKNLNADKECMRVNTFVDLIKEKNKKTIYACNILHYACQNPSFQVLDDLFKIKECKDILCKEFLNEPDSEGNTPLFHAIISQQDEQLPTIIDILIKSKPFYKFKTDFIEHKNQEGFTPWLLAVKLGKLETAKCLKKHDANVLCENNNKENGAHLIVAHLKDWKEVADYIPPKDINKLVTKKNKYAENVLHYACKFANSEVVTQLSEQCPQLINERAYGNDQSPIFYAFENESAHEIIPVLIEKNARIIYGKNENILLFACVNKKTTPQVIEAICKLRPDLINKEAGNKKKTPIFYAIESQQDVGIINALIKTQEITPRTTKVEKSSVVNKKHVQKINSSLVDKVNSTDGESFRIEMNIEEFKSAKPLISISSNNRLSSKKKSVVNNNKYSHENNSDYDNTMFSFSENENITSSESFNFKDNKDGFALLPLKKNNNIIISNKSGSDSEEQDSSSSSSSSSSSDDENISIPNNSNLGSNMLSIQGIESFGDDEDNNVNNSVIKEEKKEEIIILNNTVRERGVTKTNKITKTVESVIETDGNITTTEIFKTIEVTETDKTIDTVETIKKIETTTEKIGKDHVVKNYKDAEGNTLWLFAIACGNLDAAKYLLDNGADPTCSNNLGENAVHLIVGHIKEWKDIYTYIPEGIVEQLVDKNNKNNKTILHYACEKAGSKVVMAICELYPNLIHAETKDNKWTPIFYAIKSNRPRNPHVAVKLIIKALIEHKTHPANIEHKDVNGYTPWLRCIEGQYLNGATTLQENGAKLDCRNAKNENALHLLVLKETYPKEDAKNEDKKDTWLPLETRNQLLEQEYKAYFVPFMQKLFKTAINATSCVQLPKNYALIAFRFNSYPDKETIPLFGYAIIVDKMTKDVKSNLDEVVKEFEILINENKLPTLKAYAKPTRFQLINTPDALVKDLFLVNFKEMGVIGEVLTILENDSFSSKVQSNDINSPINSFSEEEDKSLVDEFSEQVKYSIGNFLNYKNSVAQKILAKLDRLDLNVNLLLQLYNAKKEKTLVQQQYWDKLDIENKNQYVFKECDPKELGASWLVESFYSTIAEHGVGKTDAFLLPSGELTFQDDMNSVGYFDTHKKEKEEKEQQNNYKLQKLMRTVPLVEGETLDLYLNPSAKDKKTNNKTNDNIYETIINDNQIDPNDLDNLDLELFCETVLFSFIIKQESAAKDFVMHQRKDDKWELVNIVNSGFISAWTEINGKRYLVQPPENPLWRLPQMQRLIPTDVLNKMKMPFCENLLALWLLKIEIQYRQIQKLDKKFVIPIIEEMIIQIYGNWIELQEILSTEQDLTCAKIHERMHPGLKKTFNLNEETIKDPESLISNNKDNHATNNDIINKNDKNEIGIDENNGSNTSVDANKIDLKEHGFFEDEISNDSISDQSLIIKESSGNSIFGPNYKPENAFKKLQQLEEDWINLNIIREAIKNGKLGLFKKLCDKHKEIVLFGSEISVLKKPMDWAKAKDVSKLVDYLINEKISFYKIIITDYRHIGSAQIKALCAQSPGLIKLELELKDPETQKNDDYYANDEILKAILESCPVIEELTLKNAQYILKVGQAFTSKKLKKLTITGSATVQNLTLNTPALTSITLENNNLRYLELNTASLISIKLDKNECFEKIKLISTPCLSEIDIANCDLFATLENSEISNIRRVIKFDIKSNRNSKLAKSYRDYPFLMLYSAEDFNNQGSGAEKLAGLFDNYKNKDQQVDVNDKEDKKNEIYENSDTNNHQTKEIRVKPLTIFHAALEKLESFKRIINFSKGIVTSDKDEEISDEKVLEELKNCLEKCKNAEQAKHYIKLALDFVKKDYKELSLELFDSLPENMKTQYAELGLVGVNIATNILAHNERLKTDDSACLALIALGHDAKQYERNLLIILLSNSSPVMAWRAIEQLAKIYPHIKLSTLAKCTKESLKEDLTKIYESNGNLLIQSMFIIEELAQLHKTNKSSSLESDTVKTRIDCIVSNKKKKLGEVFITFNECLLNYHSIEYNNKIESNNNSDTVGVSAEHFLYCLHYREFDHAFTHILSNIQILKDKLDYNKFEEIIKKHFDFYLHMLSEKLCSRYNEKYLGSFVEALMLVEDKNDTRQEVLKVLETLCNNDMVEIEDFPGNLNKVIKIIAAINELNSSELYVQSCITASERFKKIREQLVNEQSLNRLHNTYLPDDKYGEEAANAIASIYSYKPEWLDRIVAPLKKDKLTKTFLKEKFNENLLCSTKMLCVFKVTTGDYTSLAGITDFSNRVKEMILAEINDFMEANGKNKDVKSNFEKVSHILLKLQILISAVTSKDAELALEIKKITNRYLESFDPGAKTGIGIYLQEFAESKLETCSTAAKQIISTYGFKNAQNYLFMKKTKARNFEILLSELYPENKQQNDSGQKTEVNKETENTQKIENNQQEDKATTYKNNLRECYKNFSCHYEKLRLQIMLGKQRNDFSSVFNHILSTVKQISEKNKLNKNNSEELNKFREKTEEVGKLVAYIFAMWTYLDVINENKPSSTIDSNNKNEILIEEISEKISINTNDINDENEKTIDDENVKSPHPAQIISIFLMLGMENNKQELLDRLLQVGTGEGKSIALAGVAIVFALLGYDAHVACYSKYLANRDKVAFAELFKTFNLEGKINYGDIKHWTEILIAEFFDDPRAKFLNFMKTGKSSPLNQENDSKRILLLDEADIFFGKDFLGKMYFPAATFESENIEKLLKHVWKNKNVYCNLSEGPKKLVEKKKFKRIFEDYKELEEFEKRIAEKIVESLFYAVSKKDLFGYNYEVLEHEVNGKMVKGIAKVDKTSGNTSFSTTFGICGNAFIAFKENKGFLSKNESEIPLSGHMNLSIRCCELSFLEILKYYDIKVGVSGTLSNLSDFENKILEKTGISLDNKIRIPSTFVKTPITRETPVVCEGEKHSKDGFFSKIKMDIEEKINKSRAAIVFFDTVEELNAYKDYIAKNKYNCDCKTNDLLTSKKVGNDSVLIKDEERSLLIEEAAKPGHVTLALRNYGRGSDFMCYNDTLVKNDGVHLICTFLPDSEAELVQIEGRTCRQDDPGSIKLILSAKDLERLDVKFENNESVNYNDIKDAIKELQNEKSKNMSNSVENAKTRHELTEKIARSLYGLSIIKQMTDKNSSENLNIENNVSKEDVFNVIRKWL